MNESVYWAWLQSVPGLGAQRFMQILGQCGSPRDIYELARKGGRDLPDFGRKIVENIVKYAKDHDIDKICGILDKHGVEAIAYRDEGYPYLLKQIFQPPPVLYAIGRRKELNLKRAITIVGSRNHSENGRVLATAFAKVLAQNGVTVVSGLALGLDAAAHTGALMSDARLPTIAVIPGGPEKCTPLANAGIYNEIRERGCVLSEDFPGTPITAGSFPMRNRLLAGLTYGTLVIEAGIKSGTMHTVNFAADAGRDVFALPGSVLDERSAGTNELLREGAILVTSPYDILAEYRDWAKEEDKELERRPVEARIEELDEGERAIYAALKIRESTPDELLEATDIPISQILFLLTKLTHKGIISRTPYMTFKL